MPYALPDDVLLRWPRTYTSGFKNDDLRALIRDADAQIDATIGRLYGAPVSTDPAAAPPILKMISSTLAVADVFDRSAGDTPGWITRRIQHAYDLLQGIAAGTFALIDINGTTLPENSTGPQSTTKDYIPIFGAQPTLSERVDPQRVDDEADARTGGTPPTSATQFPPDTP